MKIDDGWTILDSSAAAAVGETERLIDEGRENDEGFNSSVETENSSESNPQINVSTKIHNMNKNIYKLYNLAIF
jgi:hypothetical protein